ncbi:UPF0690 protein C1orf52 homolog [Cucurbita pepo subsp. pepo]|uniref:UPF0690 protein C1orf52 homolog n=1 Tax=Cucurbita maxima TaxID=3661 RepID=A0A6J1JUH2_CUCMA|nr:UPF0690 protein C1orf52 homolog [Cucurbita maxima]XP_023547485.1 UPF0690 protein C1orf52 homolog [Cucurbita pepo subsp. pepo]XP_023547486.1 UPF0690 protein C1orf52 homolog [Cucurbita pepo subsp. pepo]
MKRAMPWSDEEDNSSSKESSLSQSDSDADEDSGDAKAIFRVKAGRSSKEKGTEVKSGKRKSIAVDFDTLKRHGYKGGPSVLKVPPPKENEKQDWSWSTGRETRENRETEESYEERQKTRAALENGEQLLTALTQKEKKNISFSQKEKRKRELGQASRGKNYVEEEKRTLRESGIYSGFDT